MLTPTTRRSTPVRVIADCAPAALAGVAILAGLSIVHTPPMDILRYAGFLLFAVLVPGTLVHRALRGRNPLLVADLALGAATGVALGLGAWAAFMLLGVQQYLWVWPLAVIVPFIAVPSLRRHWRPGGHTERSPLTSWLIAAALTFHSLSLVVGTMRNQDLPPRANWYYIDVYWHLANAAELTRQLPPEVPSIAGRTLRYHWFVSAHMAEAHLVSGVDLPTIILRLWEIPVVAIVLGLTLAVSRKVTGATWPGGLAAILLVAPTQLMPWSWYRPRSAYSMTVGSPTQTFCLLFLLLCASVLIPLVRGERIGKGGWAVLILASAAGAGAKPSVIPVLLGGLGLVALVSLLRRQPVRRVLVAGALLGAMFAGMAALVAQAAAASGLKLFGLLYFERIWRAYSPADEVPSTGGRLLAGMGEPRAAALALMLMGTILLQFAWVVAALPLLRRGGRARTDPALAFLAGGFLAGIAAMLVVDHAGASEIYFARTGVPFGAILASWGLYAALPRGSGRRVRATAITICAAGTLAGMAVLLAVLGVARGPLPPVADYPREIGLPFATLLAGVVVLLLGWRLLRRVRPALAGTGAAVGCAAVLAGFILQGPWETADKAWTAATTTRSPLPRGHVTAAEAEAALWVERNVPRDDVMATNVHCVGKVTRPHCDTRSHWVVALTERRMMVESWGNAEETLQQIGKQKGGFGQFLFDDQPRYRLNEAAFYQPTPQVLARMRDEYGVRWLFADRFAGPVSPRLRQLADLRYSNQDVHVYQLR